MDIVNVGQPVRGIDPDLAQSGAMYREVGAPHHDDNGAIYLFTDENCFVDLRDGSQYKREHLVRELIEVEGKLHITGDKR